jgi:hemoglobin/transferrin/lactoferrin receptor protein
MHIRFGRSALMASVSLLALSSGPVFAQDAAGRVSSAQDEITVSAERTPSTIYNSPGTVNVITDRQIDQQLIQGPRDLVRNEPGLAVGNSPLRAGAGGFNIRGIGENRVRMEIDGVRVPEYPGTNLSPGLYTRDLIDYDSLKRVEIIRGPASALYGSDAIGGVVTFVTKDPGDYLREVGRDWYAGTKLSFNSVDRSFSETFTGAARRGPWEFMLQYTRRDGHETDINSATRRANPQNYQVNNFLSKLIYETPESGRWRLTLESFNRTSGTNMLSDLVGSAPGAGGATVPNVNSIASSIAHDINRRFRVSLDWTQQVSWAIADEVKVLVYATDFDRQEHRDQLRRSPAAPPPWTPNRLRVSDFDFRQQIFGTDIQFSALRQFAGAEHRFVYGFNADFTKTSRPRMQTEVLLPSGTPAPPAGPTAETFPNKNFPDSSTTQVAAFVQDTIQYGALRIIPAVRFDFYHLTPHPDAAFYNSNSGGFAVGNKSAFAVSPKLGLTYDLNENLRVFAQYARGFRAPPYDNANFAFTNLASRYEVLPNFNLRPETSDSFEGGLRGRFADGSSFQLTAFYNHYRDFIDQVTLGTRVAPIVGPISVFQFQNIPSARIFGFEARGEWRINPEWTLTGALAYANGRNLTLNRAIDSVDPLTVTASLRYSSPHNWMVEARAKLVAAKTDVDPIPAQGGGPDQAALKPGAYAVFDLLGGYQISPNVTVRAGVFNIFNARYFNSIDVRGIAVSNVNAELYRAPGRSASVSVSARF